MTNIINKNDFKFTDAYKGSLQNLDWLKTNTIFLTLHGSHAYGTNIATSDIDYRGFCVAPKKYYLGYRNEYKNYVQNEPDLTIFECKKFFNLCLKANPNALEILFTDPKDHLIVHPAVEKILANKSMFLSKKAKHTFSGYAFGQLKRIHLHYSWITNQPTRPPTRADVGLPEKSEVPQDKILSAMAAVKKQMDIWNWHELDGVEPSIRQAIKDEFQTMLTEITQWPWQELEDRTWLAACNQIGFSTNVTELLAKERKLASKQQEWKDFLKWKSERNPTRHALEEKFGYDCYSEDTEFLTDSGWKSYESITSDDQLATLNKNNGEIEYQHFYERVKKPYIGKMYVLETRNTKCCITPNHRLLVRDLSRSKSNSFKLLPNQKNNWKFEKTQTLLDQNKSYYNSFVSGVRSEDLEIPLHTLIAIGAYVSEGCVGKKLKSGKASVLRFSQKSGGRQEIWLNKLLNERSDVRKFLGNKSKQEFVWTMTNRELANSIVTWCGEKSLHKKLPNWAFKLSSIQANLLLDVMISGDGSNRKFSRIYHTKSPQLAKDTQTLSIIAGYPSVIWGPYKNGMYQVYIGPKKQTENLILSHSSRHVKEIEYDGNVVCFSVPNETLITRKNNKVAFQGNTKHGMHLVRLMNVCTELLTTGRMNVFRPDAALLLEIRNGKYTYHELIDWFTKKEKELQEIYKTCTILPDEPNHELAEEICIETIERIINHA